MSEKPTDEVIAALWADWVNFTGADSVLAQAHFMTELSNRVSDLIAYHSDYDYSTGEISGVFE